MERAYNQAALESPAAPTATVDQITATTSAITLDNPAKSPLPAPSANYQEVNKPSENANPSVAASDQSPATVQQRPPRQPRANIKDTPTQRVAEDPKHTPRVGQFWQHDQRLNEGGVAGEGFNGPRQTNPFWRGRAIPRGAFRGGIRGRGRGGPFFPNARGGFANGGPPRSVELSQGENKEEGSSKLRMDREYELAEARDKARSGAAASVPAREHAAVDTVQDVVGEKEASTTTPAAPVPVAPSAERKWGHEGYEAMSTPDQFRGGYRGRARGARGGRGVFFRKFDPSPIAQSPRPLIIVARGGHLPFAPHHRQMHPAQLAAAARAAAAAGAPLAQTGNTPTPISTTDIKPAANDHEKASTQPTADSLLEPADESVKIKFPGSAASVVPAVGPSPTVPSASIPTLPISTPTESQAPATAATTAPLSDDSPAIPPVDIPQVPTPAPATQEPTFPSLQAGSPAPVAAVQAQTYTGSSNHSPYPMGSENGSVGSGHFIHHPGQVHAPGMLPNGEFVPNGMSVQQRPVFYPQQSQRGYSNQSPQFYPPQSPYSPGSYDQQQHQYQQQQQHLHQQRGSFSGAPMASPQGVFFAQQGANGYANGRSSPLNPYMNQNQVGGYFAPARGSNKVAIRAPAHHSNESNEAISNGQLPSGNQSLSNGGSPANGGAYYAQHYNPYVEPFIPGQRQHNETVYYPTHNGQQYAWQGYNGEQAYYDGSVAYGY